MANLVTRLLLNSTQFDNNILKSTKQIQGIEAVGNKVSGAFNSSFSSMIGIAAKFAGGIGLAMGATELFNKTVNSTQTTGDAWVKMQDEMKGALDTFYVALATGNFQGFLNNLSDAIDKAGRLSVILDNLGTKTLFNNAQYDDLRTQYQLEVDAAKARNMSDAERNKHLEKAKSILKEMVSLRTPLKSANNEAYYATLDADAAKFFKGNIKRSTWDYVMKDTNRPKVEQSAANYKNKVESYNSKILSSQAYDDARQKMADTPETKKIRDEFNKYRRSAQGRYEEFAKQFLEMGDDEKSAIASAIKMKAAANAIAVDISSKQLEVANADAKINGSFNKQNKGTTNKGVKITKDEILPPGSIAEIDKEILDLQKNFSKATTDTARAALQAKINELKEIVNELNFKANHPTSPEVTQNKTSLKVNSDPTKGLNVNGYGVKPIYTTKDIAVNNDYLESLNAISNVMGNIQSATDGASDSWLTYAQNVMTSIAGMTTAILSLSAANQVEQSTSSGAAVAESAKSAAQTPFIGWLLVGGAIASVVAALSAIPKFATGGIVGGNSTIGDMNIARVNSGEMILNGSQQGKLFSMINEGATSSREGKVTFKIKGQELVGVLDNYNSKMGKLR